MIDYHVYPWFTIMNSERYFPEEMITEILSRLPVKSLLRFKCVSELWCNLVTSQEFIKLHLERSKESISDQILTLFYNPSQHSLNMYLPVDSLSIQLHKPGFLDYYDSIWNELAAPILIGSCNGLLCFVVPYESYIVYNPSSRVFKEIPKVTKNCHGRRVYSLFTYDYVNDDYMIFELWKYFDNYRLENEIGVSSLIFSMKSNEWKEIDTNVPYNKNNFVYTDDSLCWVDRKAKMIKRFNLFTEKYDEHCAVKRGSGFSSNGPISCVEEDLDLLSAGCKGVLEFVLRDTCYWRALPVLCSDDGKAFVLGKWKESNVILPRCEPKGGLFRDVRCRFTELSFNDGSLITAKPWVESLVSLD